MIQKELWDVMDGKEIWLLRIFNRHGEYVELLSYGASLHSAYVQDREGKLSDVVLGAENAEDLRAGFTGEGVVVGRCANRIADGRCVIGGKTVILEQNQKGNCLHSGCDQYGLHHFEWKIDEAENSVHFYHIDEGKCGFNTRVNVHISYHFDDNHRLLIRYDLDPEEETVLSPTNHAYFNLDQGDVRDLHLFMDADFYLPKTEKGLPEGGILPVKETVFDFRESIRIGDAMARHEGIRGYDDHFLLNGEGMRRVATLRSEKSGRVLNVYTDMPSITMYASGLGRAYRGKNGRTYEGYPFVCLETQFPTNAVNCPQYASPIFGAHERLISETVFEFVTAAD
jgi:aldose 1-epimerase